MIFFGSEGPSMNRNNQQKMDVYEHFHENKVNKIIHYICIPLILYSTIALLSVAGRGHYNLALPIIFFVTFYYFRQMGKKTAFVFFTASLIFYFVGREVPTIYNASIFVAAWLLQIIGHKVYEKNSPAFLQNFEHLLISPAWFFARLTRDQSSTI
jgi:uncharacterized membrane protein YGL010W